MTKKVICVFLSFIIIISATIIGVQAVTDEKMVFAVASDLHYNRPDEELIETDPELLDDPIFWYANRRAALENESGFIIDEFLKQCAENDDIQFVLIPGDLADDGKTDLQECTEIAKKLHDFEQTSKKPVYVINGNHDASTNENETSFDKFMEIYKEFGYDEALSRLEGTCSYTANLGTKYRLIALDSCSKTESTEDGMNITKLNWIKKEADKAAEDGRYPILMMHHNLLDHMPVQRLLSHDFIVRMHYSTAELFADWGIKFVLSGHEHCSDATSYTSALGNTITDFATTSLTMYPLEYRVFTFTEDEIKYESKKVDTIDYEALTNKVSGYNDEQINLMKSGMNEYAKQFLKVGVSYRLRLSLTMKKMGISEDDFYYDLVYTAVKGLTDTLEMPLYGANSVQERAKAYNISIPDSKYSTGWDLATELVAMHYEGSEHFALDSTEVTILLKTIDFILLDDLSTVNDKVFLSAANSVLEKLGLSNSICTDLTMAGTDIFGPVTAGEYFLLAVVSPILYTFANDDDVDDNNGTIEGYGVKSQNIENIGNNIISKFTKIATYFGLFAKYLLKILRISF